MRRVLKRAGLLVFMLPVRQAPNPILQPTQSPAVLVISVDILRHVCVLQLSIPGIAACNLHGITGVECTFALSSVVVSVDLCSVAHLDTIVVDFVGSQGAVQGEARLGLAFVVFVVVLLPTR